MTMKKGSLPEKWEKKVKVNQLGKTAIQTEVAVVIIHYKQEWLSHTT